MATGIHVKKLTSIDFLKALHKIPLSMFIYLYSYIPYVHNIVARENLENVREGSTVLQSTVSQTSKARVAKRIDVAIRSRDRSTAERG